MAKMLPVDDSGTVLGYLDSGVPRLPGSEGSYDTLVCLHGLGFNSGIFERMLLPAKAAGFRLVAVDRRDYRRSSALSEREVDKLEASSGPEEIIAFLRQRVAELGRFLLTLVDQERLEPNSVTLLGWSLGNMTLLAFLAECQSATSEADRMKLETYLKGFILYDAPHHIFGMQDPPGAWNPLSDPSVPPALVASLFSDWVSGYYEHPGLSSRDWSTLEYREPLNNPPSSLSQITPAELEQLVDPKPLERSDRLLMLRGIKHQMWGAQLKAAFLQPSAFADLPATVVFGTASHWEIVCAPWGLEAALQAAEGDGRWVRRTAFLEVEGGNHFFHWDEPDRAAQVFADILRGDVTSR